MCKKITSKALLIGLAVMLATSCATPKKMTLLLDMDYDRPYGAPPAPELKLREADRLDIQILSETPQLAAPFNAALNVSDTRASSERTIRYTIDSQGNIDFPVLGSLHLEGLTVAQTKELIAEKIQEKGYIKDPVVNVVLENFTVTVIGSWSDNVIVVDSPSINLLQVLARSGGVSNTSKIKDLMVIRTENGERIAYTVNLQSKDLFNSPVFYLQQNDVVYMKPRGSGLSSEGQTIMTFVGTGLTLASIISNFLLWSRR